MKKIFTLCIALCTIITGFAQTDSTKQKPDTIMIGGMVIIRDAGSTNNDTTRSRRDRIFRINRRNNEKPANITTNWWILDLGFANYANKTDYAAAQASGFITSDIGEDQLKAKTGRSRNVNIWFFMQRLNLAKHVVNLKYGLGLELNNYFFQDETVRFHKNPTSISVDPTLEGARKNKLAADYLTLPIMLNFNFTPERRRSAIGFSAGISAGYLYSSRQKTKQDGDVDKLKNDFDLRKWKLSYIGELSLGPVKLYGSYAFKNMFEKGIDLTPFNVGFRFSRL